MTIIRVEERIAVAADGSNATISFDHGPKYSITISNPFTKEAEEDLAWYFEEHLTFPFTRKVRASKAAASITSYGEALFKQSFMSNPDVYADYRSLVKAGLSALSIEIAGTAQFHMLHWEAMKDPNLALPLSLQATVVRKKSPSAIPTVYVASLAYHQPTHRYRASLWSARCWIPYYFTPFSRSLALSQPARAG